MRTYLQFLTVNGSMLWKISSKTWSRFLCHKEIGMSNTPSRACHLALLLRNKDIFYLRFNWTPCLLLSFVCFQSATLLSKEALPSSISALWTWDEGKKDSGLSLSPLAFRYLLHFPNELENIYNLFMMF